MSNIGVDFGGKPEHIPPIIEMKAKGILFPKKSRRDCFNIETSSETEIRNLNILPEIAYHNESSYFN